MLKIHLSFSDSDHVFNRADNALCEGTRLQDIELRRNNEVYLDVPGAHLLSELTTAGDFCRHFTEANIRALQDASHKTRLRAWSQQPEEFFDCAILEIEGTMVGCFEELATVQAVGFLLTLEIRLLVDMRGALPVADPMENLQGVIPVHDSIDPQR